MFFFSSLHRLHSRRFLFFLMKTIIFYKITNYAQLSFRFFFSSYFAYYFINHELKFRIT